MLSVHDLEYLRGERLLFTGLSFSLQPFEIIQVEGANGSGKTSLLRLVAGLGLATEGQICWQGENIRDCREHYHQSLIYLGHGLGIKDALTPLENLMHAMAISGASLPGIGPEQALENVGLKDFAGLPASQLSAGQNQRIALARLLLHPGKLWILDEPYTALDRQGVRMLNDMLGSHLASGGMVLLTSHQAVEISSLIRKVSLS